VKSRPDELKCYRCGTYWRIRRSKLCLRCLHKVARDKPARRQLAFSWADKTT
jgi:hypothetical protein